MNQILQNQSVADVESEKTEELSKIVIFHLVGEEYAFLISDVTEVLKKQEVTQVPEAPPFVAGIINVRGKVMTVIDLAKRFSLDSGIEKRTPEHIVVIELEEHLYGILVDQVTEVLGIDANIIQDAPTSIKSRVGSEFVKGVIVLKEKKEDDSDERVLLLLDIKKLLKDDKKQVPKVKEDLK